MINVRLMVINVKNHSLHLDLSVCIRTYPLIISALSARAYFPTTPLPLPYHSEPSLNSHRTLTVLFSKHF